VSRSLDAPDAYADPVGGPDAPDGRARTEDRTEAVGRPEAEGPPEVPDGRAAPRDRAARRSAGRENRADGPMVDVLIPTKDRPAPLAATLACVLGQTHARLRVLISDQGDRPCLDAPEVRAVIGVLRAGGRPVDVRTNLPRRGLAQQRQVLLDRTRARYALFLDDDVLIEPDLIARLLAAIRTQRCGFVGSFPNAPSAVTSTAPVDRPPDDVDLEPWPGRVRPEIVLPGTAAWNRYRLHFAAHLHKIGARRGIGVRDSVLYKVAWVGGCFLVDVTALRAVGGFGFWPRLPVPHSGEDVVAQVLLMARYGGAGLAPSGAWHQEVRTTRPGGEPDAPNLLDLRAMLASTTGVPQPLPQA
jgi:hypothetical protein